MEETVKKDGKYQHMKSSEQYLYVDGKIVCKNPSLYMKYLFEKEILDLLTKQ